MNKAKLKQAIKKEKDRINEFITSNEKVDVDIEKLINDNKIVGIIVNDKVIYGENDYIEKVNNYLFKVNINSFFQVNLNILEKIEKILHTKKYHNVDATSNSLALLQRCKLVLDIADENRVDYLILGAFGCGVFGQDPTEVASTFKRLLDYSKHYFTKVIFAVPKGLHKENYEAFKSVFG